MPPVSKEKFRELTFASVQKEYAYLRANEINSRKSRAALAVVNILSDLNYFTSHEIDELSEYIDALASIVLPSGWNRIDDLERRIEELERR